MKKILLIAIVLFSLQGFGQKKLEIYNNSSLTFDIYNIITNASGSYPEFQSKLTTITLSPGASYILENATNVYRFPFLSPSSSPVISWIRISPPAASVVMTNIAAWSLGNPQVFSSMVFGTSGSYNTISTTSPSVAGAGWNAEYEMIVNPANPNDITYLITIQ